MTESLNPRNAREYRRRARPLLLLAVLCLGAGLTGLVDPSSLTRSATGQSLSGPLDEAWLIAYIVAGAGIVLGIALLRPAVEVVGLWFAAAAIAINAVAVLDVRGFHASLVVIPSYLVSLFVVAGRIGDLHALARGGREEGRAGARLARARRRV